VTEAVAWDLAERVAVRVAGREPFSESYHYDSLQPDFEELTARAEDLVASATGLRSLSGPARARVTDRPGWVRANVASFRRLLRPITDRLGSRMAASPLAPASRALAGTQIGIMLGWMSTRVLGQYDLLLVEDDSPEDQDLVYFVGPNVISLEKRFAFPPREFRLWLALHEVTHRAQFTGIPWMRGHFLGLIDRSLGSIDPDPRRFLEGLKRAVDELRAGRNPLADGGLLALITGDEQHAVIQQVQALMSLLEGHGDVTMDRAGAAQIPSAERFSRVLRERRQQTRGPARLLQQLVGLEAKLRQYEMGERFIEAVEAVGGPELLARAWEGPECLPTLAEIRQPASWVERMGSSAPARR
jgi:coenzyme F420 biosynthesis associated uncharacterized protein